jgi:hypothetical protein
VVTSIALACVSVYVWNQRGGSRWILSPLAITWGSGSAFRASLQAAYSVSYNASEPSRNLYNLIGLTRLVLITTAAHTFPRSCSSAKEMSLMSWNSTVRLHPDTRLR